MEPDSGNEFITDNNTRLLEKLQCMNLGKVWLYHLQKVYCVTTGCPGDGIGPEAGRLGLSHWAGPSVTGSAKVSQSFYGGIIIVILTKGKPVPLAWEFIYKLGEVTRVTSTILPDMGRKCVTEA